MVAEKCNIQDAARSANAGIYLLGPKDSMTASSDGCDLWKVGDWIK